MPQKHSTAIKMPDIVIFNIIATSNVDLLEVLVNYKVSFDLQKQKHTRLT